MGKLSENKGYSNAKEKMFILSTTSYLLYDLCCTLSISQLLFVVPNVRCAPTIQEFTRVHTHTYSPPRRAFQGSENKRWWKEEDLLAIKSPVEELNQGLSSTKINTYS